MTLLEHEQALSEQLMILPDSQERLSTLMQRASRIPALDAADQIETNLVRGCVSQVWLVRSFSEGNCHFRSAADSPLVAGLVNLLVQLCDGHPPAEVATFHPQILIDLGIWRNLSPTRQNGLTAVMQTIRDYATSCL
jgi:cysteine desulfuration protein SufE